MNNILLLILFGVLASCGMPVSDFSQDKSVSVISAEKMKWSGGRAGVKGIIYTIKLKKKDNITIKSLKAEGSIVPFSQSTSGKIIIIQGTLQNRNSGIEATVEDIKAGAPIEPAKQNNNLKESWIEYTLQKSNISRRINIPQFTSVKSEEELIP
ncbi:MULTISPECIES: hypothetical protein [Chryseobacterium]|uniref:hypothetical protein n=1 Tax=Chryseobacterium TaxID=59732 RepID=UPI001627BE40|nr:MULTISPECIES: hypothetical protein [Chryseobacterium]MDM1554366.1 hypothetical protein [Chryseobacterium indologenes]